MASDNPDVIAVMPPSKIDNSSLFDKGLKEHLRINIDYKMVNSPVFYLLERTYGLGV